MKSLALGVATTIEFRFREAGFFISEDFTMEDNVKNVRKDASKFIDVDKYDWDIEEDRIRLSIKPEFFNENIHELVREVSPFISIEYLHNEYKVIDEDDEGNDNKNMYKNFNKKKFPISLKRWEEENPFHDKGELYVDPSGCTEHMQFPETCEYWFLDNMYLINNLRCFIGYIPIWVSGRKIFCEGYDNLLFLLNSMSRTYYKSPLSRSMFFFIHG